MFGWELYMHMSLLCFGFPFIWHFHVVVAAVVEENEHQQNSFTLYMSLMKNPSKSRKNEANPRLRQIQDSIKLYSSKSWKSNETVDLLALISSQQLQSKHNHPK